MNLKIEITNIEFFLILYHQYHFFNFLFFGSKMCLLLITIQIIVFCIVLGRSNETVGLGAQLWANCEIGYQQINISPGVLQIQQHRGKEQGDDKEIIQRYSLWSGIDRYGRKIAYLLCENISVVACWCDSDFSIFVVFSFQLRIQDLSRLQSLSEEFSAFCQQLQANNGHIFKTGLGFIYYLKLAQIFGEKILMWSNCKFLILEWRHHGQK